MSLAAAPASVTSLVTFGDGINTLFSVPLNTTLFSGFSAFALGVQLSSTDGLNGWRITTPAAGYSNGDFFFQYDPNHSGQANDEAVFFFNGNPVATFYIVLEGTLVPEPGTLGLLGSGVVLLLKRRRSL